MQKRKTSSAEFKREAVRLMREAGKPVSIVAREPEKHGIIASMSRVGMPCDNAAAENFFSSLKNELTHHEQFATSDEARHKLLHRSVLQPAT